MSPGTGTVEIVPIDTVPDHVTVCHYDELDEEIRDQFPELVTDESFGQPDQNARAAFDNCGCEIIKFTGYYHIIRGDC